MGETLILIQQGDPVVAEAAITFLGTGSAGDPTACRRLVWPSAVSPLLAPITYQVGPAGICLNPSRTLNLDNAVLPHPITRTVRTLGTTKTIRFEESDADVIVTEIWEVGDGGSPMTTAFFRLFYEYLTNGHLIDPAGSDFIRWEPRDRTTVIYDVDLLSLSVGGGSSEARFDVADVRADRGVVGTFDNALTDLLPFGATGLIDREVTLRMKIIGAV